MKEKIKQNLAGFIVGVCVVITALCVFVVFRLYQAVSTIDQAVVNHEYAINQIINSLNGINENQSPTQ